MSYQFDFDQEYEDVSSGRGKTLAKVFAFGVSALLFSFSALSTFGFFLNYAGGVFSFISPVLGPYIAGFLGAVAFEGMSFFWRYFKAHHADTAEQMEIAGHGATAALAGGVLITVVYLALDTPLLQSVIDDQARFYINILGAILIILGVSGNFALWHFYSAAGAEYIKAAKFAELTAKATANTHSLMSAYQRQVMKDTRRNITEAIPDMSEAQARQALENFLAQQSKALQKPQGSAKNAKVTSDAYAFVSADPNRNGRQG